MAVVLFHGLNISSHILASVIVIAVFAPSYLILPSPKNENIMDETSYTPSYSSLRHSNFVNLSLDILTPILEYLPFKSILLLTETGDSRMSSVRYVLCQLELRRTQIRPKKLPLSFITLWSRLQSLSIIAFDSNYLGLTESIVLPPSLRSLTLAVTGSNFLNLFPLLCESYVSNTKNNLSITNLTISYAKFANLKVNVQLSEAETLKLGNFLSLLPLASLDIEPSVDAIFMSYLPSTLTSLAVELSGPAVALPPPILPPQLLTLRLLAGSIQWLDSIVIPRSVTNLRMNTRDRSIWATLPPSLQSLSISGLRIADEASARQLPQTLTSLSLGAIPSALLPHLPQGLLSFHSSISPTAALFPPSLTRLSILDLPSHEYKNLPRGLKTLKHPAQLYDESHLPDLPPKLDEVHLHMEPSEATLLSIPSRHVLKKLVIRGSHISGLFSAFSRDGEFLSLEELDMGDILAQSSDSMKDAKLPSLTSLTLKTLQNWLLFPNLPLHLPKLKSLRLTCNNDHGRMLDTSPPYPAIPLFSSLPQTLTSLEIEALIFIPSELIPHLPTSCTDFKFSTLGSHFSFKDLAGLPSTLKTLHVHIVAVTQTEPMMETSLSEILCSLPRHLQLFNLKSTWDICLHDCSPKGEQGKSDRINIFLAHQDRLPFLMTFLAYPIDPERAVMAAILLLERLPPI